MQYEKGIGCHTISEIEVEINEEYETFETVVGVDDYTSRYGGKVKFQVYGDGELLEETPLLTGADDGRVIEADVSGVNLLKIVATDDGVHKSNNHADWADAKLTPKAVEYVEDDPFGYCGEYYDAELDMVYLRNRYYSPEIGRFITEDPIKDGFNWYVYCGNNPIMFVDPIGSEYIVVSGGAYKEDDPWPYEFIEPAIKKLNDLAALNDGENIKWIIANEGWSQDDVNKFNKVVSDMSDYYGASVSLMMINDKEQLIDYINYKNGDRSSDLIRKFVVFSHGFADGTLSLGYNYGTYNEKLNIYKSDINTDNIKTYDAFDSPNSFFYSCNTGKGGQNSFAQAWVNITGGKTWAYVGKTNYANITKGGGWDIKVSRKLNGFSLLGSANYPEAASGAYLKMFTK